MGDKVDSLSTHDIVSWPYINTWLVSCTAVHLIAFFVGMPEPIINVVFVMRGLKLLEFYYRSDVR